jgi:polysaccharide biosynthesis protein PslJ
VSANGTLQALPARHAREPVEPGWRSRVSAAIPRSSSGFLTAYLLLLMLIPSELVFAPLGGVGTPAEVIVLCILLWYCASWLLGRAGASTGGRPARVTMFIFVMSCLASFVAAMTRYISVTEVLSAGRGLIELLSWSGLVIVVSQTVRDYRYLDTLLRRAVVIGTIVAAIGVFEFYSGLNVTNYVHLPGLSVASTIGQVPTRDGFTRPSSTAIQPIEFSVVMAMLLPFALHQALDPERTGWFRKWVPVVLIAVSIPMTVSRSGILALAIVLLILVPTWNGRQQLAFLVFGLLGIVAMRFLAHGLLSTITAFFGGMFGSSAGSSDLGVGTRTSGYAADWFYIVQRPFFGRGFATFLPQLYRYDDNQFLTSLVETGFVGLAAFCGIFLGGMQTAGSARRMTAEVQRRHLGQAMVASLAAAAVSSATFDSLSFPMFTGLLFFILGAAGAYRAIMIAERDLEPHLI